MPMIGFGGSPRDPEQRKIRPAIAVSVLVVIVIVIVVALFR